MMLFKKDDLKSTSPKSSNGAASAGSAGFDTFETTDALHLYHDVISEVLAARGVNAAEAYKPDSGLWIVPAQPAPVVLRLLPGEEDDFHSLDTIEAVMRLGPLPAQHLLAFYRALLEANHRLQNAAFSVEGEGVFLRHQRPLAGLDEDELNDILSSIVGAAQEEFGALIEQFIFGASILR